MREAVTYSKLMRGALHSGWLLYRIADGSWGKKPFDIGGVDPGGRGVAIEVKVIKSFRGNCPVPADLLRAHQGAWLEAFGRAGGRAYLVLASPDGCWFVPVKGDWRARALAGAYEFALTWDEAAGSLGWPS